MEQQQKMEKIKLKFLSLFILSFFHLTKSFDNGKGCSIKKGLEQAGFMCIGLAHDKLNEDLEFILNRVSAQFFAKLSRDQNK